MNAVMVFRCSECGWSTTRYDEIDGHEDQLEPGHLVIGSVEDTDKPNPSIHVYPRGI